MRWSKFALLIGFFTSACANATMYKCDNDHTLMVKDGEVVLDTTEVYLVDGYPDEYVVKDAKFESIPLRTADNKRRKEFTQAWSRSKGYLILFANRAVNNKGWDYKNALRCYLSNPNEEPPVPPAKLN